MDSKFFVRANGDRVDYFDGEVGSDLLIYHHGTPGAGPLHADVLDPAQTSDLRVVELVRPGYGNSTRQPNRTVADVVKLAMIGVHGVMKEKGLKSKMLLQVHDELVFDVHKSEIEILQKLVKHAMESAVEMAVPLDVEMEVADNWLEAH